MAQTVKTGKSAGKRKGAAGRAAATKDPVDCLMDLVAEHGWRGVTLARVAEASGVSLADLYSHHGGKTELLVAYARRIDATMLAALGGPAAEPGDADAVKDRLFEAIMARFDALAPHKPAIRILARELPGDPAALAAFLHCGLRRGLDWTLATAGLDSGGLAGLVRRKLLGGIYLDTLRVWLKDDSPDLAATMAHLDKRLGQALRWLTGRSFASQLRDKFSN